jgi:hypothetical protein
MSCAVCRGRSAWDFLQDFYLRVDRADQYINRLEVELHGTRTLSHQVQLALAEQQACLAITRAELEEERLNHGASCEELTFEHERHMETEKLLDLAYGATQESEEIAKELRCEMALLQYPYCKEENPTLLQLHLQVARGKVMEIEALMLSKEAQTSYEEAREERGDKWKEKMCKKERRRPD